MIQALLGLALFVAPALQGDPGFKEIRFHRVHLLNGNFIDGLIIRQTPREVVLKIVSGEMSIRQDMIDRVEDVKMRSVFEAPAQVERLKPAPGATGPLKPGPGVHSKPDAIKPIPPPLPPAGRPPSELFPASAELKARIDPILEEYRKAPPGSGTFILSRLQQVEGEVGPYLASLLEMFPADYLQAIAAMIVVKRDPASIPILARQAESVSEHVRYHVANALGNLELPEGTPILLELLKDPALNVRSTAITALHKVGTETSISPLLAIVADPQRDLRTRAIAAGLELGNRYGRSDEVISALTSTLTNPRPDVRADVIGALGRSKRKDLWTYLAPFLTENLTSDRAAAANGLASLLAPDSAEAVVRAMPREEEESVRTELAAAAEGLRIRAAVPHLIEWLRESSDSMKTASRKALTSITGQSLGEDADRWAQWWGAQP